MQFIMPDVMKYLLLSLLYLSRGDKCTDGRRATLVLPASQLRQLPHPVVQAQKPGTDALDEVFLAELLRAHDALEEVLCAVGRYACARMTVKHLK